MTQSKKEGPAPPDEEREDAGAKGGGPAPIAKGDQVRRHPPAPTAGGPRDIPKGRGPAPLPRDGV